MQYLKNYPIFGEARGGEDEHQGLKGHVSAAQEAIAIVGGGARRKHGENLYLIHPKNMHFFYQGICQVCQKRMFFAFAKYQIICQIICQIIYQIIYQTIYQIIK